MSDSLSSDDVARLRQAANAATKAPWFTGAGAAKWLTEGVGADNAAFIGFASPATILALLNELTAMRVLVDGLTAARDTARQDADRLAEALQWMACQNCDDRKCMSCVFREMHDECREDCFDCVPQERIENNLTARYANRDAALVAHSVALAGRGVPAQDTTA